MFLVCLIIAIIIIYIFDNIENFDIGSNTEYTTYEAPYKSTIDKTTPIYYNPIDQLPKKNINCCLVEKKYLKDDNSTPAYRKNNTGGHFEYKYKKLANENCKLNLFHLNNNKQLFFDGYNNWSNDQCIETTNQNHSSKSLGSCRLNSKECVDFVTKEYCDKYNMTWSPKTCHDQLDYVWQDPVKINKPNINSGTFKIF